MKTDRALLAALFTVAILAEDGGSQGLTTPADWRWRLDRPATLVTGEDVPDTSWRFVGMPPGWHVTTGPGVVLFHPDEQATGRYSLSADFVLFPNPSESPFGLVLGAADLRSATADHLAVQLRRDGAVRVLAVVGGREQVLSAWRIHSAIRVHPGTGVVTNRLRVSVAPDSIRAFVNDSVVAAVGRDGLRADGQFGLQIGERMNFHITILDHIRHLAPARSRR
jgi:hypothetical protein